MHTLPHVLLSNDDGVHALGLRALADAFLAGGWRVTVAAPDTERSAASHGITIKKPIVAGKVAWPNVPADAPLTVWALDGTPADCVKVGLHELVDARPDLVVSGINNGWNIGTDVHYSGTVGAAMEAAFEGTQAMAVSTKRFDPALLQYTATLAEQVARRVLRMPLPPFSILNLNTPDRAPEDVLALVEAPLTCIQYTDAYDRMDRIDGRAAFWIKGDIIEKGCTPQSDLYQLLQGHATLTWLNWDLSQLGIASKFLQE